MKMHSALLYYYYIISGIGTHQFRCKSSRNHRAWLSQRLRVRSDYWLLMGRHKFYTTQRNVSVPIVVIQRTKLITSTLNAAKICKVIPQDLFSMHVRLNIFSGRHIQNETRDKLKGYIWPQKRWLRGIDTAEAAANKSETRTCSK